MRELKASVQSLAASYPASISSLQGAFKCTPDQLNTEIGSAVGYVQDTDCSGDALSGAIGSLDGYIGQAEGIKGQISALKGQLEEKKSKLSKKLDELERMKR